MEHVLQNKILEALAILLIGLCFRVTKYHCLIVLYQELVGPVIDIPQTCWAILALFSGTKVAKWRAKLVEQKRKGRRE